MFISRSRRSKMSFSSYFVIITLFILCTQLRHIESVETVIYDASMEGFKDWSWRYTVLDTAPFKTVHVRQNLTNETYTLYRSDILAINKKINSIRILSPLIKITPAWRITLKTEFLVDGIPFNGIDVTLSRGTTNNVSLTKEIRKDQAPVNRYTSPSLVHIGDTGSGTILQKYIYFSFYTSWHKITLLKGRYPNNGANVTINKFIITYLNCPQRVYQLAKYPNSPAARELSFPVNQNGECVENAVKNQNFQQHRLCDIHAEESFNGRCMCDKAYEVADSTEKSCKKCDDNHFKGIASLKKCVRCGDNSADIGRVRCSCFSDYYRFSTEKDKSDADCYEYPLPLVSIVTKNITDSSATISWQPPKENNNLPVIYLVKCIEPLAACHLMFNGKEIRTSKTDIQMNLISFTAFKFTICSHNTASLTYIDNNVAQTSGVVKCSQKDVNTTEGRSTVVQNLDLRFVDTIQNTIDVTWQAPLSTGSSKYFYILKYAEKNETFNSDKTSFFLKMGITGLSNLTVEMYVVSMVSLTQIKGPSVFKSIKLNTDKPDEEEKSKFSTILGSVLGGVSFILVVIVLIYAMYRFRRYQRCQKDKLLHMESQNIKAQYEIEMMRLQINTSGRNLYVPLEVLLDDSNDSIYDSGPIYEEVIHSYFYNFDSLTNKQTLGEGNFAFVLKATAKNICGHKGESSVAVKQLKAECNATDREDFEFELELLTELKHHPNVVKLLGYCTNPDCIILEFLPGGDLLTFLTKSREYHLSSNNTKGSFLSQDDLLKFAHQICEGMKHLAKSNIVHRDLAARNVLVGYNRVCKISDLGLARKLNADGIYTRERQARLPVKWMPLESIKYGRSTIKSDVWSFGIVLYEIVTIGCVPYPKYKSKDILALLEAGERMKKPPTCNNEIYSLMVDCWREYDKDRPSFAQLSKRIDEMRHNSDAEYLNFDVYNEKEAYISLLGTQDLHDDDFFLDSENTGLLPQAYHNKGVTNDTCIQNNNFNNTAF